MDVHASSLRAQRAPDRRASPTADVFMPTSLRGALERPGRATPAPVGSTAQQTASVVKQRRDCSGRAGPTRDTHSSSALGLTRSLGVASWPAAARHIFMGAPGPVATWTILDAELAWAHPARLDSYARSKRHHLRAARTTMVQVSARGGALHGHGALMAACQPPVAVERFLPLRER